MNKYIFNSTIPGEKVKDLLKDIVVSCPRSAADIARGYSRGYPGYDITVTVTDWDSGQPVETQLWIAGEMVKTSRPVELPNIIELVQIWCRPSKRSPAAFTIVELLIVLVLGVFVVFLAFEAIKFHLFAAFWVTVIIGGFLVTIRLRRPSK